MACYLSVQFNGGRRSPLNVDNPNNLASDNEDNTFNCFASTQVKFSTILCLSFLLKINYHTIQLLKAFTYCIQFIGSLQLIKSRFDKFSST